MRLCGGFSTAFHLPHISLSCVTLGLCVVCGLPFPKYDTLRWGYRKDRDCSRLFLLSVAAPRLCIVRYFRFSSFNRPPIPLDYSSLESPSRAFFSLPIRYRQRGHCLQGHRLTSALLPQQQSRHLSRIALPLVILFSIHKPPSIRSQQLCRHPPLFLCPVCSSAVAAEVQRLAHFLDPVIDSLVFQALGIVQLCH